MNLPNAAETKPRDYLLSILPTREMVDQYITPSKRGEAGSVEGIGWVPVDHHAQDGVAWLDPKPLPNPSPTEDR